MGVILTSAQYGGDVERTVSFVPATGVVQYPGVASLETSFLDELRTSVRELANQNAADGEADLSRGILRPDGTVRLTVTATVGLNNGVPFVATISPGSVAHTAEDALELIEALEALNLLPVP